MTDTNQTAGVETVDVLAAHRFDEQRLLDYLKSAVTDFGDDLTVRQFQGGQSNPTYLLESAGQRYVLRKKPPGDLLPKAHQVEREYRVMHALAGTDVPVPELCVLCEDDGIIGTAFFVMRFVAGVISASPAIPALDAVSRHAVYVSLATTLARLHELDWRALGLEDFGRAEGYLARQIKTWSRQYDAAQDIITQSASTAARKAQRDDRATMNDLIDWLTTHLPEAASSSIVHGDYRVGNMIIDADARRVAAVIDWELSTIGHPLADLGYLCMPYYLPADTPGIRGLKGVDLERNAIPSQDELVAIYCAERGIEVEHLSYYIAHSLFRMAAILQGIHARALQGNASNANALQVGERASMLARTGWAVAVEGLQPHGA